MDISSAVNVPDKPKGPLSNEQSWRNNLMTRKISQLGFSSETFKNFSSSKNTINWALLTMLLYMLLGTLVFRFWVDGWNTVDAMYYSAATFTTVGYGDLYPETEGQRIFGIFYIFGAINIIGGVVFGVLFDALFDMFESSTADRKKNNTDKFMEKFHGEDRNTDKFRENVCEEAGAEYESNCCQESIKRHLITFICVSVIIVPALIIGYFEGWSFVESIYFFTVTATTVGYGDLSPKLMGTRIAAIFYLPLCVGMMAHIFSKSTNVFFQRKTKEKEEQFLNRSLTEKDLHRMDLNKDSKVDVEEFLKFMLVAMGKVDQNDIDQIMNLFQRLDNDNDGSLDMDDILYAAYGEEYTNDDEA